ncbi:MAG TPA: hypothetical protein VF203_11140 [Burkholderiales bacterium]
MSAESHEGALICVASAIPAAERAKHFALARELFHELAEERTDLPDGYAIRFPADAFDAVTRFVANERKCCPFLNFDLSIAADGGPLWLRMTGPAGTREVVQAELDLGGSCDCCSSEATGKHALVQSSLEEAIPLGDLAARHA